MILQRWLLQQGAPGSALVSAKEETMLAAKLSAGCVFLSKCKELHLPSIFAHAAHPRTTRDGARPARRYAMMEIASRPQYNDLLCDVVVASLFWRSICGKPLLL